MHLAFVLGRTPELARQEIESTAAILPFQWSLSSLQPNIVMLKPQNALLERELDEKSFASKELQDLQVELTKLQHRLGGTVKIVYLLQRVERNNVASKAQSLIQPLQSAVTGKRTIGVSVYGPGIQPIKVGMTLKKQLRGAGEGVRIVLPQGVNELSSAQLFHNKLTLETGLAALELIIIEDKGSYWLGISATTQDIEFYTKRDFHIPHPDAISGMLPPKLAQSMINLAVGTEKVAVYDPFCGNGRIILEAWLMGLQTFGSDIVEKKVWAANENLQWLSEGKVAEDLCWTADATLPETPKQFRERYQGEYVVVGEPYLGKPLRATLQPEETEIWRADILPLYVQFLETWAAENLAADLRPKHMFLVFPRAKVRNGKEVSTYEVLVDDISRLGYSSTVRYCYDRPDSFVRRDLVLIEYK